MKPGPLAFGCGLLFALGLGLAGMTQPSKVLGFLDIGGVWDPSLALVMLGAIAVHLPLARLRRQGGGAPADDVGCASDDSDADVTVGPSKGPTPPALWLRRAKLAYANAIRTAVRG